MTILSIVSLVTGTYYKLYLSEISTTLAKNISSEIEHAQIGYNIHNCRVCVITIFLTVKKIMDCV